MTEHQLSGRIDVLDTSTNVGTIAGPDGRRYRFGARDFAPQARPAKGQQVWFVAGEDGRARDIHTMMSSAGAFDMGRVIRRTVKSLRQHWLIALVSAVIFVGAPYACLTFLNASGQDAPFVLALLVHLITSPLLGGLLAIVAANGWRGRPLTLAETLRLWVPAALPLIGLSLLAALGVAAGLACLLAPGLVLMVWWSVAQPVLAVERRPISESLGRSIELTEGYRGLIFALGAGYAILSTGVNYCFGFLVGVGFGLVAGEQGAGLAPLIAVPIAVCVNAALGAVGRAALYHELVIVKEGDYPSDLAAVFD